MHSIFLVFYFIEKTQQLGVTAVEKNHDKEWQVRVCKRIYLCVPVCAICALSLGH